jgi:hypothetical protein
VTTSASLTTALQTAVAAIADVGIVHPRPRFTSNWSTFLDLFKGTIGGRNLIRGWMIARDSVTPADGDFSVVEQIHNYTLTGVAGFADSDSQSQYAALQSLCDTIIATLNAKTTLGVTGVQVNGVGPCSLESFEDMQFASTLCHVAVINVPIRVFLPFGTA